MYISDTASSEREKNKVILVSGFIMIRRKYETCKINQYRFVFVVDGSCFKQVYTSKLSLLNVQTRAYIKQQGSCAKSRVLVR